MRTGPDVVRYGTIFRILMPSLAVKASGDKLVLSWPTNMVGLTLQSSLVTSSVPAWIDSPTAPDVVGGQFTVTNAMTGSANLFRLRKP